MLVVVVNLLTDGVLAVAGVEDVGVAALGAVDGVVACTTDQVAADTAALQPAAGIGGGQGVAVVGTNDLGDAAVGVPLRITAGASSLR